MNDFSKFLEKGLKNDNFGSSKVFQRSPLFDFCELDDFEA